VCIQKYSCKTLQDAALHCNTPQHTASNTLQHTATHPQHKQTFIPNIMPARALEVLSKLQHSATHCNTLQHTATHCNTTATKANFYVKYYASKSLGNTIKAATHRSTPQHTATHRNTLQHTATHCNTLLHKQPFIPNIMPARALQAPSKLHHTSTHLQHTGTHRYTPVHTATHRSTPQHMQHTTTYCNTLQHKQIFKYHASKGVGSAIETATNCKTLQYTATHRNTPQHTAPHRNTPHHATIHRNTLQHTAAQAHLHSKHHASKSVGSAIKATYIGISRCRNPSIRPLYV